MERKLSEKMEKYILRSMKIKQISEEDYGLVKKVIINGKMGMKLKEIVYFPNLENLIISNYQLSQDEIEFLETLHNLKVLQLDKVLINSNLSFTSSIKRLYLVNIDSELKIDLNNMKCLSYLKIYECSNIVNLEIHNLLYLKEIHINNSTINQLNGLDSLFHLQKINIDGSTFHKGFYFPPNSNLQISNKKNYMLSSPKICS